MMTTHVLSAGDGYLYYTRHIATGDVSRERGTKVTDYYTADGNPPGVWMGRGAELLGLSGQVTEDQMRALFGEGLHPNADAITAQMRAAGANEKDIEKAIKLGRAFYKYDVKDSSLRQAVEKATEEFERVNGRKPDRDERRQIRMREGAIAFREVHNRPPLDNDELAKYVTNAMKPGQQAMTGIDHTFSVPKTVSVLWALGDRKTAQAIEGAHERAIQRTITQLEDEALATRAGVNGVRQIDIQGGVIVSRFRHHESRTGDPHLHDHAVISAKVMGADGKWRSFDSRLLLRSTVSLSEEYNKYLFDELEQVGFGAATRTVTTGKQPVLEVAGVPHRLIDVFSTRKHGIKKATDALVKEYVREHGRTPDHTALIKLSAQAWQQTRPAKDTPRSLAQLRADVRRQAITRGSYHDADLVAEHARKDSTLQAATDRAKPPIDLHAAAAEVMNNVETARSTWGEHHVKAEITRWVSQNRYRRFVRTEAGIQTPATRDDAEQFLLRTTLKLDSIKLTPDHVHGKFKPLTRDSDGDGESFYTAKRRTLYTSTRVLEAELRVLTAARTTSDQPAAVTPATFARALADQPNKDAAQVRLAREFVTSRTQLVAGVGPAGAGKTRSMRLAAHAVGLAGGRMFGLAPSKQAAKVFQNDVHVPAFTIDAFVTAHRGAARSGREVSKRYRVAPGDVVVIDEAAMASTTPLDEAIRIITAAGGYTRLSFDHAQITAVGAGGVARLVYREVGAIQLENVYRFSDKHEQAASKILRESAETVDPFAWYKDNGRIIAASRERITELLFADYQADLAAGREAVMGAPTRDYVDELNGRAQAHAIATGTVTGRRGAKLNDGHLAHVGDRIMTRLNNRELLMNQGRDQVDNGDLYTVTKVHRDGSLTVTNTRHHGRIQLPADYVRTHTHLGYAFTAHQEQGDTFGGKNAAGQFVEGVSRGIVNARTARANAYVLATRGVTANVLYVEVEPGQHPDDVLAQIARNVDTNLSAHEMIEVEANRNLDLNRLVDEHADIVTLANQKRFEALVQRVLGPNADKLIDSDGWEAAAAGLARAEKYGLDVAEVLTETWNQRDFGDAEDVGAVMSWRIENHLEEAEETASVEPLPEPGIDTGTYEWAVDRTTVRDPLLPEDWREHLTERAAYIDQRMTLRGAELAIERPIWTDQLGPVPEGPARHKQWMRLAAEIDLFRARYKVPTDQDVAVPETLREQPLGKNLAARVTALHKSTAIRAARGNTRTADLAKQLEKVTKLAQRADRNRPISEAENAAAALNPEHRDLVTKKLAELQDAVARTQEAAGKTRPTDNTTPPQPAEPPTPAPQRGPRLR